MNSATPKTVTKVHYINDDYSLVIATYGTIQVRSVTVTKCAEGDWAVQAFGSERVRRRATRTAAEREAIRVATY